MMIAASSLAKTGGKSQMKKFRSSELAHCSKETRLPGLRQAILPTEHRPAVVGMMISSCPCGTKPSSTSQIAVLRDIRRCPVSVSMPKYIPDRSAPEIEIHEIGLEARISAHCGGKVCRHERFADIGVAETMPSIRQPFSRWSATSFERIRLKLRELALRLSKP